MIFGRGMQFMFLTDDGEDRKQPHVEDNLIGWTNQTVLRFGAKGTAIYTQKELPSWRSGGRARR